MLEKNDSIISPFLFSENTMDMLRTVSVIALSKLCIIRRGQSALFEYEYESEIFSEISLIAAVTQFP